MQWNDIASGVVFVSVLNILLEIDAYLKNTIL